MEESLALQVVRAFIAKINAHTADGVYALLTADHWCVDTFGPTGQGRDPVRLAWQVHFANVPEYRIVCQHVIAEDQTVVVFGTVSGTDRHAAARHAATPRAVPAVWKAVVQGTRVAEWQVYYGLPPAWGARDASGGLGGES